VTTPLRRLCSDCPWQQFAEHCDFVVINPTKYIGYMGQFEGALDTLAYAYPCQSFAGTLAGTADEDPVPKLQSQAESLFSK
jgi:hypothetical protein